MGTCVVIEQSEAQRRDWWLSYLADWL